MIRETKAPAFLKIKDDDISLEAAVRLNGLIEAYGKEQSFLKFWHLFPRRLKDRGSESYEFDLEKGHGLAALFGSTAIVSPVTNKAYDMETKLLKPHDNPYYELMVFLDMQSDIKKIRTNYEFASFFMKEIGEGWQLDSESVMNPAKDIDFSMPAREPAGEPVELSFGGMEGLRKVYSLLSDVFDGPLSLPSFEDWYVDVSHRVRHKCSRIVGYVEEGEVLACAMTVAENETGALIGAVATHPDARGRGYGRNNVLFLAKQLADEGKKVLLSPKNQAANQLYKKIGFVECGRWGELKRI